jgi:hypothetical protein
LPKASSCTEATQWIETSPSQSVDSHSDKPELSSAPDQGASIANAASPDVVAWATAAAWAEVKLSIADMVHARNHVLAAADRGDRDPVRVKTIASQQLSKEGQ